MSLFPTSPSPPSRKNLDFFTNAEFVVRVPLLLFTVHLELNLASLPSRKRPSALFHSIFIPSTYSHFKRVPKPAQVGQFKARSSVARPVSPRGPFFLRLFPLNDRQVSRQQLVSLHLASSSFGWSRLWLHLFLLGNKFTFPRGSWPPLRRRFCEGSAAGVVWRGMKAPFCHTHWEMPVVAKQT